MNIVRKEKKSNYFSRFLMTKPRLYKYMIILDFFCACLVNSLCDFYHYDFLKELITF